MLACWFVSEFGANSEEAISRVRSMRPHSVETPEQEEFVKSFYEAHADARKASEETIDSDVSFK